MTKHFKASKLFLPAAPAIVHMSAYANTLSQIIPDLYAGLDVVSREMVGMIPSVTRNVGAERAAVGQNVVYQITEEATLQDTTPAMTVPEPTDKNPGTGSITISKSKNTSFGWTGEEARGVNHGPGMISLQADYFAQGLRKLTNAIEFDLVVEAAAAASAGYGTAGTTPFGTNVGESAQMKKLLDDAGADPSNRALVGDTSMGAALRTLGQLTKANEAGTVMTLRDGELLNLNSFSIKESGQMYAGAVSTVGTAAGATTDAAGYAKGATTIALASAGTGTIIAGDFIKFAGDDRAYRVVTGDADVSGGGTVVIAAPGLIEPIPAAATNITVVAARSMNLAFPASAVHLVARQPALPDEGDLAIDRMPIVDPRSGLVFEVSIYPGYRKVRAEVAMAWGQKAVKGEHIAALFG